MKKLQITFFFLIKIFFFFLLPQARWPLEMAPWALTPNDVYLVLAATVQKRKINLKYTVLYRVNILSLNLIWFARKGTSAHFFFPCVAEMSLTRNPSNIYKHFFVRKMKPKLTFLRPKRAFCHFLNFFFISSKKINTLFLDQGSFCTESIHSLVVYVASDIILLKFDL